MGHKTHPFGFRLGITTNYNSHWHVNLKQYSTYLKDDENIRTILQEYLNKKNIKRSGIAKIIIDRNHTGELVDIRIASADPTIFVGKSGTTLDDVINLFRRRLSKKIFRVTVQEIKNPEEYAAILADILIEQLESRLPFRRAMKTVIERAQKSGVQGIKVQVSGRLNGAEIARTEWLREGRVPLQTLRARIDYSYKTAQTIYGTFGIKIWLFKGEQIG